MPGGALARLDPGINFFDQPADRVLRKLDGLREVAPLYESIDRGERKARPFLKSDPSNYTMRLRVACFLSLHVASFDWVKEAAS